MIGEDGDNYLSVAPGANYRLTRLHIDRAQPLIAQAAMVVLQYEIRPDTLEHVIELAFRQDRKVMLNLAPARPIAEGCLRRLTYLIVNESEAEFLCGFPINSLEKAREAAQALRARGPEVVTVTRGARGACVCGGGPLIHIPAFPVTAVDATAAGDVFCGSLAVSLVEGKALAEGVRFASAAAAIAVTRLGAQPSIPSRDEIERFLREHSPTRA
jgi:ribokinase